MILAGKKDPCYFCDFCDICGHFGAPLGFFFSKVFDLDTFVILAIFAIFVRGFSLASKKNLVTFAISAIFADISRPFLASSFSKS